jgi:hypothetical protein
MGMSIVLLILISLTGLFFSGFYFKRNIIMIQEKNKSVPSPRKRVTNYFGTVLWYGYLMVFFAGLTINNLFT